VLTFMAECFWPDMSEAKVRQAGIRAGRAARAASRDGAAVRYLGAILVPADEVAFCLLEGTSAQLVAEVSERAQIPFERILETSASTRPRPPHHPPTELNRRGGATLHHAARRETEMPERPTRCSSAADHHDRTLSLDLCRIASRSVLLRPPRFAKMLPSSDSSRRLPPIVGVRRRA
jgi:hypothetical protein